MDALALVYQEGERSRPANPNTQDLPLAADSAKGMRGQAELWESCRR